MFPALHSFSAEAIDLTIKENKHVYVVCCIHQSGGQLLDVMKITEVGSFTWKQMEFTSPKMKLPSYSAPSLQRNLPIPCIIPFMNAPSYLQPLSECAHPISIYRNESVLMTPRNCSFTITILNQIRCHSDCMCCCNKLNLSHSFLCSNIITHLSRCRPLWGHQYHLHKTQIPAQIEKALSPLS